MESWKNKLKGVTIYRDGSRFPILSTESQLTNFQTEKEKEFKMEDENGNEVFVKGDDIMKLPDGTLTTMYNYLNNSNKNIKEVLSKEKFEDIDAWLN